MCSHCIVVKEAVRDAHDSKYVAHAVLLGLIEGDEDAAYEEDRLEAEDYDEDYDEVDDEDDDDDEGDIEEGSHDGEVRTSEVKCVLHTDIHAAA